MAEAEKIVSRKAKMLLILLLLLNFFLSSYVLFPYIWPYPSDLKFAATSKHHNIIITGTMLSLDKSKTVGRFKIKRIIKNTSGAALSENQIITLTAPISRPSCLVEITPLISAYPQLHRQHRKTGEHGLLYAEGVSAQSTEKEEYIFHRISFQSDNIVKRMLLQHYKHGRQHDGLKTALAITIL